MNAVEADYKAITKVGPYFLLRTLGQGGYATVKLGIHETTGMQVAVKMIHKGLAKQCPSLYRRIFWEISTLEELKHPHITSFIDFFENEKFMFIVLEYVNGGDLYSYLRKGSFGGGLPAHQSFLIFYQLLSALEYCHSFGIAHRDIKPENILIDKATGSVKISDFGLANPIQIGHLMDTSCGSPHYAAPEIVRGNKYDGAASDTWSLGIILFLFSAGHLPFRHSNTTKLLELICHGSFTMPATFNDDLRDLFERMLHQSYHERITLAEIKTHLWWLANCSMLGLSPNGIHSTMTHSSNPPSTTDGLTKKGVASMRYSNKNAQSFVAAAHLQWEKNRAQTEANGRQNASPKSCFGAMARLKKLLLKTPKEHSVCPVKNIMLNKWTQQHQKPAIVGSKVSKRMSTFAKEVKQFFHGSQIQPSVIPDKVK